MAEYIVNATPTMVSLGTNDLSRGKTPVAPLPEPQHLPKFYIYAKKGPTTPQLSAGGQAAELFGSETFDARSMYYNHSTHFAASAIAQGNVVMLERIIPADAAPEANISLWLDVLPTQVDDYERNPDGSIKVDVNGNPIVIGQIQGYKVKWVARVSNYGAQLDVPVVQFGGLTSTTGTMSDPVAGTTSIMYPIMEFKASFIGEYGNNVGLRIVPLTDPKTPVELVNSTRAFPFEISVVTRADANSSPEVVKTIYGGNGVTAFLKPDAKDPSTGASLYVGDNFIPAYNNTTDPRYPLVYGDIGYLHVYQNYIDDLLTQFHTAESAVADAFTDFTSDPADKYMVNILTGVNSNNVPYHSFVLVDDVDSVRWTNFTNVYLGGGSDGTMNDTLFAQAVSAKMAKYSDPNSEYMDTAINVESAIWDSGFPIETKRELARFISVRKDTYVVLSTYVAGEDPLTNEVEGSRMISLRTYLQMYPESDYFGTPTARGVVVAMSGIDRNSVSKERRPLSLSLLRKVASYMGSGDGRWRNGLGFDRAPNNVITDMYDIQPSFVPSSVRSRFWDAGAVWAQPYDRKSYFFPTVQTVYTDDTSVLNSFYTMAAIAYLNKVSWKAWRQFTGSSSLTNAQLTERVKEYVTEQIKGKFDNNFVIVPEVTITEDDAARGYSWTLTFKVYAPNMKTVMTSKVEVYRIDNLNG